MLTVVWMEEFLWIRQITVSFHIEREKFGRANSTKENVGNAGSPSESELFKRKSQLRAKPKSSNVVVILLWNPKYRPATSMNQELAHYCPELKCKGTSERRMVERADAIVFEGETLKRLSSPPRKRTGQVWVYSMKESPAWGKVSGKWDNLFNWTMTYRRDSDVIMTYNSFVVKDQKSVRDLKRNFLKKSEKGLLWFVSHCHTPGKREKYVSELKSYFPVDIIGVCGIKKCKYTDVKCEQKLLNEEYNFYFSAENVNCKDYITEKAFRIMGSFNILPVVRGGANYSLYLPEHSFVDSRGFTNVSDVGVFLTGLQQDRDRYNAYFRWRASYKVGRIPEVCELCRKLRNQERFRGLYLSMNDWWRGNEEKSGHVCFNK